MSNLVQIKNNKATTTSMLVAQEFGKAHKNILRDINRLINEDDETRLNFEQYETASGDKRIYNKTMVTPKGIQELFKII
jgi:Rha family phage regulatory protein